MDTVTTLAAATTGLKLAVTADATTNGKDWKNNPGKVCTFLFKWTFDAALNPSNETAKGKTPFSVK